MPVINNAYYDTSGGVIKNYYEFEAGRFWIPAGETLYIYFQGHLATTAYYQSTLVDNPSTPANDPIYSKGASFFPGHRCRSRCPFCTQEPAPRPRAYRSPWPMEASLV